MRGGGEVVFKDLKAFEGRGSKRERSLQKGMLQEPLVL